MSKLIIISLAVVSFIFNNAISAEIEIEDCPNDNYTCDVSLLGNIKKGDADKLNEIITMVKSSDKLKNYPVRLKLESRGGDVFEAIRMAELIQANDAYTYVGLDTHCNSACVIVAASGANRNIIGKIGVHSPFNVSETSRAQSRDTFDRVEKSVLSILKTSGITPELWYHMIRVPSYNIEYLDYETIEKYSLWGKSPAYEDYVAGQLAAMLNITKKELFARKRKADQVCDKLWWDIINDKSASRRDPNDIKKQCEQQMLTTGSYSEQ